MATLWGDPPAFAERDTLLGLADPVGSIKTSYNASPQTKYIGTFLRKRAATAFKLAPFRTGAA
jgi:hypothetical protein